MFKTELMYIFFKDVITFKRKVWQRSDVSQNDPFKNPPPQLYSEPIWRWIQKYFSSNCTSDRGAPQIAIQYSLHFLFQTIFTKNIFCKVCPHFCWVVKCTQQDWEGKIEYWQRDSIQSNRGTGNKWSSLFHSMKR